MKGSLIVFIAIVLMAVVNSELVSLAILSLLGIAGLISLIYAREVYRK